MSDYQPVVGSDDDYELAPTSTKNMEALDKLRMRAPFLNDRDDIARNYGYEDAEEAQEDLGEVLSPPRFWEEAAFVVFKDLEGAEDIDFAEVRRAVGNFTFAGNEQFAELMSGLNGLVNTREG